MERWNSDARKSKGGPPADKTKQNGYLGIVKKRTRSLFRQEGLLNSFPDLFLRKGLISLFCGRP